MQAWDWAVQRAINQGCACPALDWAMSAVSNPLIMSPLGLALAIWAGLALPVGRSVLLVGVAALLLFVTESVVSGPLKDALGRRRPHEAVLGTRRVEWRFTEPRVRVTTEKQLRSRGSSFPSSHVMNNGCLLVAFSWATRRRGLAVALAVWTGIMMFSRVYVGAHFPSDVLGSVALSLIYASLVCAAVAWGVRRWLPEHSANLLAAPPGDS